MVAEFTTIHELISYEKAPRQVHASAGDASRAVAAVIREWLPRWALLQEYGKKVVPLGPLSLYAKYKDAKVAMSFQYETGLHPSDGKALRCFLLDNKTAVESIIQNNKVVIASPQKPACVYYGWKPFSDGNLVNEENLPASTLKIEVK